MGCARHQQRRKSQLVPRPTPHSTVIWPSGCAAVHLRLHSAGANGSNLCVRLTNAAYDHNRCTCKLSQIRILRWLLTTASTSHMPVSSNLICVCGSNQPSEWFDSNKKLRRQKLRNPFDPNWSYHKSIHSFKRDILFYYAKFFNTIIKLLVNQPQNLIFLRKKWICLLTRFLEDPYPGGSPEIETLS